MQPILAWPLSAPTLSGGSWLAGLPLTNLLTDDLGAVARSTTDANTDTIINIDHGAAKASSVIALVRHNMRSAATWRIRLSANVDMSSPAYDSGTIAVWPEQWPTNTLPTGHPNAATRLLTDAQITALNPQRDAVHVFSEVTVRYRRIEIFDATNSDTYVQAGRLVDAPRYQPGHLLTGATDGFDDGTVVGRSLSRGKFFSTKRRGRSLTGTIPLDFVNAMVLRDFMQDVGVDQQFYFVMDPAATYDLQRKSFLATLRQLSATEMAQYDHSHVPLALEEVL